MNCRLIDFQKHGDARGQLVSSEYKKEIPFLIKRVYYIFDLESGVRRGFHSHKTLEQVLVCVSGSCKIHVDDGKSTHEYLLDAPSQGLYVGVDVWHEMYDFSNDAILLSMASDEYNEEDYIRNYDDFLRYINNK